jgi:hypothetical protein
MPKRFPWPPFTSHLLATSRGSAPFADRDSATCPMNSLHNVSSSTMRPPPSFPIPQLLQSSRLHFPLTAYCCFRISPKIFALKMTPSVFAEMLENLHHSTRLVPVNRRHTLNLQSSSSSRWHTIRWLAALLRESSSVLCRRRSWRPRHVTATRVASKWAPCTGLGHRCPCEYSCVAACCRPSWRTAFSYGALGWRGHQSSERPSTLVGQQDPVLFLPLLLWL